MHKLPIDQILRAQQVFILGSILLAVILCFRFDLSTTANICAIVATLIGLIAYISLKNSSIPLLGFLFQNLKYLKIVNCVVYFLIAIFLVSWVLPSPKPKLPVRLTFEVEDSNSVNLGKLGQTYYTNDIIHLTITAPLPCWYIVFSIDNLGLHAISDSTYKPYFNSSHDFSYSFHFLLDTTQGKEVYYAVVSPKSFIFDKSLKRFFGNLLNDTTSSKGPSFLPYNINLPEGFSSAYIYFNHKSH
jgi:hypothetical protein